jgi:hypothetical protein
MPSHVDSVRCSCDAMKKKPQPAVTDKLTGVLGCMAAKSTPVQAPAQHGMACSDASTFGLTVPAAHLPSARCR